MLPILLILAACLLAASLAACLLLVRTRHIDRWIVPYVVQRSRRRRRGPDEPVDVLFCICDHYEPKWNRVSPELAWQRVNRWVEEYPRIFAPFRDSDGRPPRHTFFYPLDEYDPDHLDAIAALCRAGFGEVEIHLHHDNDTPDNLRNQLLHFRDLFFTRHGVLSHRRGSRDPMYAFLHGNWALDNSRPDGRRCGVNNELTILRETGCYADFTLPSAPDPCQTRKINSIYWAKGAPHRSKSHNAGIDVGSAAAPPGALMMIQGPLILDWGRRKLGVVPTIENSAIQANRPATLRRLDLWLQARIHVPTRPDWLFVKLHSHGAQEGTQRIYFEGAMAAFHQDLANRARDDSRFRFHYVTAREMYNLARAAEAGWTGSVADALDYELLWPHGHAAAFDSSAQFLQPAVSDVRPAVT